MEPLRAGQKIAVSVSIVSVKLFVWPLDDDPNHAPLATNNAEYYHFRTDINYRGSLLFYVIFIFFTLCASRWPVKSAEFLLHMLKVTSVNIYALLEITIMKFEMLKWNALL